MCVEKHAGQLLPVAARLTAEPLSIVGPPSLPARRTLRDEGVQKHETVHVVAKDRRRGGSLELVGKRVALLCKHPKHRAGVVGDQEQSMHRNLGDPSSCVCWNANRSPLYPCFPGSMQLG